MPKFVDNIEFIEPAFYGQIRTYELRFPYRWTISWSHALTTGILSTIVFATRAQEADGLLTTQNGMWEIFNFSAGGGVIPFQGKLKSITKDIAFL